MDVRSGRNELSITREQPRHVIETIARSDPSGKMAGVIRTNDIAAAAPVKAKRRSSRFLLLPGHVSVYLEGPPVGL